MPEQIVLGIDPGISGAYAFYWPNRDMVAVEDAPIIDGNIDAANMASAIDIMHPSVAIIERVSAMPKQGVSSTFKFGVAYGVVQGIVAAHQIPIHFVTPTTWKKHFNLSPDKEQSRARAIHLWPRQAEMFKRKKDHGRAEAALLARYYAEKFIRAVNLKAGLTAA
jgi:crossover junction endodeoxyribonuclease RuvC